MPNSNLSEQQELIRLLQDSARHFSADIKTDDIASLHVWQQFAAMGWLALPIPESLGGAGLGAAEIAALSRVFGETGVGTRFISQCVLPGTVLAHSQASDICTAFIAAETTIALAWQEQSPSIDPLAISCQISKHCLSGQKLFVAGADIANHFLVSARDGDELIVALVQRDAAGVSIDIGARTEQGLAKLSFNNVKLEADAILLRGPQAEAALQKSLQTAQIAIAAELEGLADACLQATLAYISTRKQFKQAIGSFQSIRHRCADLLITNRLAASSWRRAVAEFDDPHRANAAKARCGDSAIKVAKEAIQMHGAMGFTEEAGIGNYMRRALSLSAWLGSPRLHRGQLLKAMPADNDCDNPALVSPATANNIDCNQLGDDEFRLKFRHWLQQHYPKQWRQDHRRPFLRFHGPELRQWLRTLNDHGWRAPDWPKAYGGMALSFRKQLIYKEELNRISAGRVVDNGETQLGPTLMKFGTDAQKAYYLPKILNSDNHWAQGYSEPNAGSDLASLATKAELQDDTFIVNGQKIWTTFANECSHIYMLVRTGQFEKKQQGISFLLIDLASAGISIRPILNIAGETELCEVFFDNVEVPRANLVGELHQGWAIAKSLLGHERIWLGDPAMAMRALALTKALIEATAQQHDAGITEQLAVLNADLHDYRGLYADICDQVASSGDISPEVSMLKVFASELLQAISEFNVALIGDYGMALDDIDIGQLSVNPHWQLMMTRPTTIYAGCNEIQRDILAAGMGLTRA